MALTREDVLSLIRLLSEDGELRDALRRVLIPEPFIVEVRLPTDWMTRVDERLDKLDKDVASLKQDVTTLKQDVGMLKGKVLEVDYRTKAASIFGLFLRNGRDASEFVSGKLDEAIEEGLIAPQEADFVMAADLLWMGNVRRGRFEGETVVFVGEASWTIEPDNLERAEEKAQILRKAGVWAAPFVSGSVWLPPELKSQALERKVLCATDSRLEPSRADWEAFEELLAFWKP
ncbi:MAG: hypothetical protein RMK89_02285 [Armatimonadota bacterium]|nr:hypothetical protein [Armatimonadota bacterium]MDW8142270.1 hypothetical protein [Armatimonadota bacterium]